MSSADPSEAALLRMRSLKLEALEKGDLTDFSFLVGTEKDSTAEVRILKFWISLPQLILTAFTISPVGALLQERLAGSQRVFPGSDQKWRPLSRPHETHQTSHFQNAHQVSK